MDGLTQDTDGAAWHSSGNPSSGSTGTGAISIPIGVLKSQLFL